MSPISLLLPHILGFSVYFYFYHNINITSLSIPIGWYLQADASAHASRGSDALVEKRRADKMLISRMLDMEEAFMTEKVRCPQRVIYHLLWLQ